MKTKFKKFAAGVAGIVLATSPVFSKDALSRSTSTNSESQSAARLWQTAKASDVIGAEVKNDAGEKLGTIDNLAVDLENGRVVAVVLSSGGMGGIGEKLNAVPPGSIIFDTVNRSARITASKEQLRSAPKFESSNWSQPWQSNQVAEIYFYYGQPLYLSHVNKPAVDKDNLSSSRQERDNVRPESNPVILPRLGLVQRASKVIGSTVKNLQDEKLGDVQNLVIDLSAGRILAVIVSSGGFLGLGQELSAIPPNAFRFSPERDVYLTDISKNALAGAPHFKASEWPNFNQPNYSFSIYNAYKVEPYFQSSPFGADNTAVNSRDREGGTLTPFDQSNDSADLNLIAQIRKELMGRGDLSIYARNVKIISTNGRVTLRGPVSNQQERQTIDDIAKKVAGQDKVVNQLDIKNQ